MNSKLARAGLMSAGALLAFLAGLAVGQRTIYSRLLPNLAAETQFNLTQRVDTLARLRTGDSDGAVASLERAVDTATVTLAQGRPWSELNPDVQFVMQVAKAYRTKYPPSQPNASLDALLETIPMPDVRYCSPAMQRLLDPPR